MTQKYLTEKSKKQLIELRGFIDKEARDIFNVGRRMDGYVDYDGKITVTACYMGGSATLLCLGGNLTPSVFKNQARYFGDGFPAGRETLRFEIVDLVFRDDDGNEIDMNDFARAYLGLTDKHSEQLFRWPPSHTGRKPDADSALVAIDNLISEPWKDPWRHICGETPPWDEPFPRGPAAHEVIPPIDD